MALYKIKDFDPDYRNHFDGGDVKDLDLYSGSEKIGSVNDVLVDEDGRFRYLVISTGAWIFGKKVLLPIGRAQIDYDAHRVYAQGLTKSQVEQLPEFTDEMKMDYHSEEQVRGVYRADTTSTAATGVTGAAMGGVAATNASLDTSPALDAEGVAYTGSSVGASATPTYDQDNYNYDLDRDLYKMDQHDDRIRLYEERLIANKRRAKAGEVTIGKHVETETARVSVPIEKERVVVERVASTDVTAVPVGEDAFHEGQVARVEVYEETPDVRKEAFVREEVRVTKVVDQDIVNSEEQIRREELDVDTQGRPVIDDSSTRKV
ncbi:MAG: DUF2382 domain-containing protein [Plectolyngbya sp. WJT66-NPBG17]|jgi:uncharacterized protein (TIGR02271 family)|nr:DUF2382 domain-containing protein [Plectolyngbya sp. WJT66-NPBG17]MBW4524720.1 DUF2382 domain-containing protein [Phormidium tanganyikae FI6-MK23]